MIRQFKGGAHPSRAVCERVANLISAPVPRSFVLEAGKGASQTALN